MRTLLSVAVVLVGTQALAQQVAPGAMIASSYGGYGYSPHSSTYAEGVGHGIADVVRSIGEANFLNSKAAINFEDARRIWLDNVTKSEYTYFETRRYNTQQRAELRGGRPTTEQAVQLAQARMPRRLGPGDLDPFTGRVYWPVLLRNDHFAADRAAIEELLAVRATRGQSSEDYFRTRQLVALMSNELKARVEEVPPAEYVAAKRFLDGLNVELISPGRMAGSTVSMSMMR